jgi:miniconductance mechanosensitive channel
VQAAQNLIVLSGHCSDPEKILVMTISCLFRVLFCFCNFVTGKIPYILMIKSVVNQIALWLKQQGVSEQFTDSFATVLLFIIFILISGITYFIARKILLTIVIRATRKTETKWDDVLLEKKFFIYLANLLPVYIIYILTPSVFENYPKTISTLHILLTISMVVLFILAINAFLNSVAVIYQDFSVAKSKPIKGYVQVVKIFVVFIGIIVIIANLFGKNPIGLIGGLGAFSAVLMLVFKDPILGFASGIQLSVNKMLAPGDWISLPKYDIDGTVIDIALTTVKVQNFDKSISTIPTYVLISESFKNNKGIEESGGRRIKRSLNIDMKSVKFCTPEMLQKFSKIEYVKDYVESKQVELKKYNLEKNIDDSVLVNGRRQTNIGVFRAYLMGYLREHPAIHDEMPFLVRQLQPSEKGIPIEIVGFSRLLDWTQYENLQSDIFDHILAVIPEFELRLFQNRTGEES